MGRARQADPVQIDRSVPRAVFAELLDEWAPTDAPNERLFRLGSATATALARPGGSVDALARYFEYWLLRLEGVYPAVDRCPRCSDRFDDGARLSVPDRAYVCGSCQTQGPALSAPALAFLRGIGTRTPAQVADEGVADRPGSPRILAIPRPPGFIVR